MSREPDSPSMTRVLALNEAARRRIPANARLEIVPGATHLFEEPGTLEQAARLACRWFQKTLNPHAGDHARPATRLLHEQDPDRR
jgi:putative phosphoribosyl transferase